MKAILLARVSTEEQRENKVSLDSQLSILRRYAEKKKFDVIEEYSFDESAFKSKRLKFTEVIKRIQKELRSKKKDPIALCCVKVDRLARGFGRELVTLEELRIAGSIELHFPSENHIFKKDSAAGELLFFTQLVGFAKYYSDSIRDNVKRALDYRIKKGEWLFPAPVGYKNIVVDDTKTIVQDSLRSHFVVKMFEMYATGNYSMPQITNEMEGVNLKTRNNSSTNITLSAVQKVLTNPFYYGEMRFKHIEGLYPHIYKPLISRELFDKVQAVRQGYKKKPSQYNSKPFIFRGLISCKFEGCGCTITGEEKTNRHGKKYIYYSCTNYKGLHQRLYVREEKLLEPIYMVLKNIQLPNTEIKALVENLRVYNEAQRYYHKEALDSLHAQRGVIQIRISRLTDLRVDDGIDSQTYNDKLKEYKDSQAELLDKIAGYDMADREYYTTVNMVLSLAKRAYDIFKSSEVDEKRQLLNYLLQNFKLGEKNLYFKLKTPFDTVLQISNLSSGSPQARRSELLSKLDWAQIAENLKSLCYNNNKYNAFLKGNRLNTSQITPLYDKKVAF